MDFSESLRLLCVSSQEPSWVGITIQLGNEKISEPHFRWSSTPQEALTILRREIFDAILIVQHLDDSDDTFSIPHIFRLLEAMRTSGHDEPALLLISQLKDEEWEQLCRLECDVLISSRSWDAPALVPFLLRSVRRNQLQRKNQRIESSIRKQNVREKTTTEKTFKHLQQILHDHRLLRQSQHCETISIPDELKETYNHLLRTFCMMGEGTLTTELTQLSRILSTAGLRLADVVQLHVEQTEHLVDKLGARGTRHVLARADLLIIELLMHLGDERQNQLLA